MIFVKTKQHRAFAPAPTFERATHDKSVKPAQKSVQKTKTHWSVSTSTTVSALLPAIDEVKALGTWEFFECVLFVQFKSENMGAERGPKLTVRFNHFDFYGSSGNVFMNGNRVIFLYHRRDDEIDSKTLAALSSQSTFGATRATVRNRARFTARISLRGAQASAHSHMQRAELPCALVATFRWQAV